MKDHRQNTSIVIPPYDFSKKNFSMEKKFFSFFHRNSQKAPKVSIIGYFI